MSRSLRSDTGQGRSGHTGKCRSGQTQVKVAQVRHRSRSLESRLLRSDTGQGCSGQTRVKAVQVGHGSRLLLLDTGQG